jgi:pimeloyl-ACP methyl ester carboxylesterase
VNHSAFILAASLALWPALGQATQSLDRMVSIGSHRLEVHLEGEGTPTVVIDSGLFDEMGRLAALQESISRVTRVITYNRAGYGRSEPGPLPRDCRREAEELKALLDALDVSGSLVLVGHSLGALNIQTFASLYPDRVAGIVLMDPPPLSFILGRSFNNLRAMADSMTAEWQAIADQQVGVRNAEEQARADFFRMIASEHREMFARSAKEVAEIRGFGDTPLLVLASGSPNPAFGDTAEEFQAFWIEQSRVLAKKSANGRFALLETASHHLYLDAPALVAESIVSVLHEAGMKKTK